MKKLGCILAFMLFTMARCKQDIRRLKREPIIDGSITKISKVPYFVSIVDYDRNFQQWFPICGASIISNKWILTAAHCISGSVNGLKIRTGFDNYFSPKDGDYLHDIYDVKFHPNYIYEEKVNYNDIGLINLTKPIDSLGNLQMAISLPSEGFDVRTGLKLNILGFGLQTTKYIEERPAIPNNLLSGTVKVMERKNCEELYLQYYIENHFCATSKKNEVAIGDSVGPEIAKSQLIGIISTGGMKVDKYPRLYIDVRKFVGWIKGVVCAEHFNAMEQRNSNLCVIS